ncbi:MAG: hypothetical protein DRP83_00290 [Planctomycetota bacterium]|nr:MAG: hypothetical protein DRP83_00290 [Planctomycetota bacterium]
MAITIGDYPSTLLYGLSDFWQRFFRDADDLQAYYQSSEIALGEAYLDLLTSVLNVGVVDTPLFDKEFWRLFAIKETDLQFMAGVAASEDRFIYDMPGSSVNAEFLQNTIFSPTIELERDVDFEVQDNDGYLRFFSDPFRAYQESDGEWFPAKGLAWRYANIEVGNKFTDRKRGNVHWYADSDVKRGDTLRILAYTGTQLYDSGGVANGQITYVAPDMFFTTVVALFDATNVGDIIKVKNSTPVYDGFYVVKEVLSAFQVLLEPMFYGVTSSSGPVEWEFYKEVYYGTFQDYEIDYIDKTFLVGPIVAPYPLDLNPTLVYSVVRERAGDAVVGYPLAGPIPPPAFMDASGDPLNVLKNVGGDLYVELNAFTPFTSAMVSATPPWGITLGAPYNQSFAIVDVAVGPPTNEAKLDVDPSTLGLADGDSVNFDSGWAVAQAPPPSDLSVRHVVPGSVRVYANRTFGGTVVENEDFVVDYYRGRIIPTKPWDVGSSNHASFQYMHEVFFSAGGETFEMQEGRVKEISYWVPQVDVDNFSLYYNYGSMLNRFEASSESYKAFLRGIMHFYVFGPILKRTEAALNVIAGLPLVRADGEILQSYSDGVDGAGNDGTLVAASSQFNTPTYTFSELDVGGYVVISDAVNAANEGSFKILEVVDANTVELETTYGFVDETPLDWQVTRFYQQTVVTDKRTYAYPFLIPLRPDVMDSDNYGVLTFNAFEPLTLAFTVVDYLEDPTWWHNEYIPEILWKGQPAIRRLASTSLVDNVFFPSDDARVGDPGLYYGADDEGNVTVADSDYRHTVAFVLFDRYLKMHMFNIEIDENLEMDAEFRQDLDELILVAKPSYTYPYVRPGQFFEDSAELWDLLEWYLTQELSDTVEIADNYLTFGSFLTFGDFYTYNEYTVVPTGVVSPPPPGPSPPLPIAPNEHIVRVSLDATVDGGVPVVEGTHYTFDYDPTSPTAWTFTPDVLSFSWDPGPINFSALVVPTDNIAPPPQPDTRLGYTPIFFGGLEPLYVRKGLPGPPVGSEEIDRAIEVEIDDGGLSYIYP